MDSSIYSQMLPKTVEHSTIIIFFVVLFTSLTLQGSGRFVQLILVSFFSSLYLYMFIFCLQTVFIDDPEVIIEDVDFCKTHVSLIVKQMQSFKICVVDLPLKTEQVKLSYFHLSDWCSVNKFDHFHFFINRYRFVWEIFNLVIFLFLSTFLKYLLAQTTTSILQQCASPFHHLW